MSAPLNLQLPPGGVLVGLGADLIEVARIKGVLERHGERFLDRILTDEEKKYCSSMGAPHKHIAARFAAKNSVALRAAATRLPLMPYLLACVRQ